MNEIHKKQILILSCFYKPFGGGAEVYVDEIVKKLKNDYDFIILTSRLSRKFSKYEEKDGVRIIRIGLGCYFDKYLYPIVAFFKIFSIREKDLIHAVMESYAGLALLLYRIIDKKTPALLTLQSGNVRMPKFLFRKVHQAPDKIQAISKYLAQRAKNFGARDIEIIPNGINLEQFNPALRDKQKHKIICVAHLRKKKGHRYLINSMPKVLKKFPDAKLILIGEGPERKNLESRIKDKKLNAAIELKGKLNPEQVRQELSESEVFVLSSLFEGQGIVILEAQASKIPVIASNTGGISDIVKDGRTGILVGVKNSEQIADAMIKIFSDKNFAKILTQNALREVQQYDWQNISQKIDKIYQKLLLKKVLFISLTYYNFSEPKTLSHLDFKFSGLSKKIKIFVLARGRFSHQKKWRSDFYLLPKFFLFWPMAFLLSFYLCLFKKIDTVVCQSPLAEGFIGVFLKKILRKELIVEVHGDWVEGTFLSRKRRFEFLERKIIPYLARFSLKNADKILAVSQATKAQAHKISKSKHYFVFPAFTDLDIFLREQDIKFNDFILFVGHLEKVKGIEYLIDAFNNIKDEFPNFKLVLIGKGGERKKYQLSIINYKLQDKVEFTGELPLEQVRNIMKNCYCLVLPSLSEGLGRVLMEAMALGKPVIGSNVGGIPDLIKDGYNGFLTEPKNSNDLHEKIKILLRDKNLAIQIGRRGRETIEQNFSNQKYIDNYIKMINK